MATSNFIPNLISIKNQFGDLALGSFMKKEDLQKHADGVVNFILQIVHNLRVGGGVNGWPASRRLNGWLATSVRRIVMQIANAAVRAN